MLIWIFETIELLRRSASIPNISFVNVIELALLKLPHMSQEVLPFAVLFGGMVCFWRLTRSYELVVTRGAGVSVWQFLLLPLLIALLIGVFQITVINPLASTTLARYERVESLLLKGKENSLAISGSGLWLRQANLDGQSVVYARHVFQQEREVELQKVTVFMYSGKDKFRSRIDGKFARLEDGFWRITDAWVFEPEKPAIFKKEFLFATDLTLDKIQDNFAPPETMSFWNLPGFILTLEKAGFSAVRHRLHWHTLLAAPMLMVAMVLVAATFTLRHSRRGATTTVIGAGVFTGFALYFFSDVVFALGLSDSIPVTLAAWTPSGVATLLGLAMLLHLEDG